MIIFVELTLFIRKNAAVIVISFFVIIFATNIDNY